MPEDLTGPIVIVAALTQFAVREADYSTALESWRCAVDGLRENDASFHLGPRITDVACWQADNAHGAPDLSPFAREIPCPRDPGPALTTAIRRLFNLARPDSGRRHLPDSEAALVDMLAISEAELRSAYTALNGVARVIEGAAPWAREIAYRHRGKPGAVVQILTEVMAAITQREAQPQPKPEARTEPDGQTGA